MDEAGQPLGRASPDDESGLEPHFSVPSAVGGNRCADAVNHSFIASVQASQWGGVAYSPAIRPRPLGPRQAGAPFVDSELDWRLWRDHLDTLQDPNVATMKREADAEIARI